MGRISGFIAKQFEVSNFREYLWLMGKLLFAVFIIHELYLDFHYLKYQLISYPRMLLPSLAKRVALVILMCLAVNYVRTIRKKGKLKELVTVLIVFQILLCIFADWWYPGTTGWFRCGLGGIFYMDGPYIGRVVDADTGEPVPEVMVAGVWKFKSFSFMLGVNSYADARESFTGSEGHFVLGPARRFFLWPLSVITLDRFRVYKPGYETLTSIPKYPLKPIHVKLIKAQTIKEKDNALLKADDIMSGTTHFDRYKIRRSENIFLQESNALQQIE